jgi:CheY-like chemotaxis protein/HPt (histidine-containing phosphotransfer) domain-containing protein
MPCPPILVVDDNPVNRTMLLRMLECLGLHADAAEDGDRAVAAATARVYDLILMDCMMPVMDGLEATRRIRAASHPSRQAWIIAVTANTLRNDRARCLAAGMNDYMPKPFTLEVLEQALARWATACQPDWRPRCAQGAGAADDGTDFTGLRQLAQLAGPAALAEVAGVFLREADALLAAVEGAGTDPERLRASAHKLKGACGSVGLVAAQRLAAAIETRSRAGDADGAAAAVPQLALLVADGRARLAALRDAAQGRSVSQ